MSKGLLIVLSGPSGVGKGTIVNLLLKRFPEASLSVSCTTRAPRVGERDGVNYFFYTKEKFLKGIEKGDFLEFSEHFGNFYGTPKFFVEEKLKSGDVILEIEPDGALNAKAAYPDALLIMIAPPSREELIARLRGRCTEDEQLIEKRVARADYELSKSPLYDFTVVNDKLQDAVDEIAAIIENKKRSN